MRIILASKSPRRKEILDNIGVKYEIVESNFEETMDVSKSPEDIVRYLAYKKAEDVASRIKGEALVIGADTLVVYNSQMLGKPKDNEDAFKMLKMLSGKWHSVYTGICVMNSSSWEYSVDYECSRVKIRELSDKNILNYIECGEPSDKAGSYAIQGRGSLLVEKIEGCYFNVVGLPVFKLSKVLCDFGIDLLKFEVEA